MWIPVALFIVTVLGLGRSALVLIGLYKDPILWTFEQYGPDERLPLPLVTVAAWLGGFLIAIGLWISLYIRVKFPLTEAGVVILLLAGTCYYYYSFIWKWYYRVIPYPRWHHELLGRTTRYERRRIAYMWLHLPWRLRLMYNSSDKNFFVWADFVIMGTIREEDVETFDEGFYAGYWNR
jgi:hypothetical protein